MKIARHLLPVLLVIFALFGVGCSHVDKTNVEEVILSELDLLKNLDSDTAMKYISYQELFPDATQNTELPDKVQEVFSLFFQDFDYKIRDIHVDQEQKTAAASLDLTVLDAKTLAKDFSAAHLQNEITEAAANPDTADESQDSLEERYLLLNNLLTSKNYKTVQRDCTIELTDVGKKESEWEISKTYSLENDLVGGLMTYLSDPDILPPEDTLKVYLKTLKKMSADEMCGYLGISSLLNTEDSDKNAIAAALTEQIHKNFDYEIKSSSTEGYKASIETEITTFDSDAILEDYEKELDAYLSEVEAVIDGPDTRYQKSYDMLLSHIENNEAVKTAQVTFHLENDGASWKLEDNSEELGAAIFGALSDTPENTEDTASEEADSEEDDFEEDYPEEDYPEEDYSEETYFEEDYSE